MSAQVLRSALKEVPGVPDEAAQELCGNVRALLEARDVSVKALHEELKSHGVRALGVRVKIVQIIGTLQRDEAATPAKVEPAAAFGDALELQGVSAHVALRDDFERLVRLGHSSNKELHDALRGHGLKALGQRQKVLLSLQPYLPPPKPPPKPPPPTSGTHASFHAAAGSDGKIDGESDGESDGGLALEENGAPGASATGDGESDGASDGASDGLELEENAAGSGDESDGVALEENDGSEEEELCLEENPVVDHPPAADRATRAILRALRAKYPPAGWPEFLRFAVSGGDQDRMVHTGNPTQTTGTGERDR